MTTTQIRIKALTAGVGAVIATMAAPALLVLGVGTAQAGTDISILNPAGAIGDLPVPAFNPQPDPPGSPDSDSDVSVGNPDTKVDSSLGGPDTKVDGGTRIDPLEPNRPGRASSSLSPGETVGIILHG
jgi:hypothetical protein